MKTTINKEELFNFLKAIDENNRYTISCSSESVRNSFHDYSDIVLCQVKTSGSSGGDCYGGRASDFYIDHEERVSDFKSSLNYLIYSNLKVNQNDYAEELYLLCESNVSNSIDSYSDYSDYYGNGSNYDIVSVSLNDFLHLVIDSAVLENFKDDINNYTETIKQTNKIKRLEKEYENITNTINKFNKTKSDEAASINQQIDDFSKKIIALQKKLQTFDKVKDKELNSLNERKSKIENELAAYQEPQYEISSKVDEKPIIKKKKNI